MDCGEQGGKKVMCWAGVVLGKLIIHWFEYQKSLNRDTYLEMLKDIVWPKIGSVASRKGLWLQQDGASVHTMIRARAW